MRPLSLFEKFRHQPPAFWAGRGGPGDPDCGVFVIRRRGVDLRIIASIGDGWDHLSISTAKRCPIWDEMNFVAEQFFDDDEAAMQLHVPVDDHINFHPYCLHWWRPHGVEIPRPPSIMVGPK